MILADPYTLGEAERGSEPSHGRAHVWILSRGISLGGGYEPSSLMPAIPASRASRNRRSHRP